MYASSLALGAVPNASVSQPSVIFLCASTANDFVPSGGATSNGAWSYTVTLNQALVRPLRLKIKKVLVQWCNYVVGLNTDYDRPTSAIVSLSCLTNSESGLAFSPLGGTLALFTNLVDLDGDPGDKKSYGRSNGIAWESQVPTILNLTASGNLSQIRVQLLDPATGQPVPYSYAQDIIVEVEVMYT